MQHTGMFLVLSVALLFIQMTFAREAVTHSEALSGDWQEKPHVCLPTVLPASREGSDWGPVGGTQVSSPLHRWPRG